MQSLKSTLKYFGIAAVMLAATFPAQVQAQTGWLRDVIAFSIGILLAPLYAIFTVLIALQLVIINALVSPAIQFTTNELVIVGWRYMRDIVNLGLALAIIVIAIGFILRMQTYGSQRTLVRLIAVAILVNFSLVIAGVFIDTAAILTRAILGQINIIQYFYAATGFVQLQNFDYTRLAQDIRLDSGPLDGILAAAADIILGAGQAIIKHVMLILFSIIFMVAVGALMIMLLIRIARLWLYLVLAPLAWMSWIFPASESYWKRWWHEFLNWTFFAPFVLFFLAFSLRLASTPLGMMDPFPAMVAQYVLGITLIIFSLMLAQQSGVAFAGAAIGAATSIARWPAQTAWRGGLKESKGRFATSSLGKALEERFARSRIPGVGAFADSLRGIRTKVEDDSKKSADRYKILSSEQISQDLTNPQKRAMMSQADLLARARVLNDRGEQLPDSIANTVLQTAHNTNPKFAEQFLPTNPQLVKSYEETIARRTADKRRTITDYTRRMTIEQAENIKASMLKELKEPDRALFASGMQQSVLAHMLDKNHESGTMLLETLRNTTQLQKQLQDAGMANDRIAQILTKTQGMLKSPQIAHWVPGEATTASEPKITEEELERLLGTKRKASK